MSDLKPFADFAPPVREQSPLRRTITAAYRRSEPDCLAPLIEQATMPVAERSAAREMARALITALRAKRNGVASKGWSRNSHCRARKASR
jgi:RHH-type proline utilization regulon transcriptional repressor/proline dehydrogenase/delta 1-pyrroline-5-carboxylate dehydrogenase